MRAQFGSADTVEKGKSRAASLAARALLAHVLRRCRRVCESIFYAGRMDTGDPECEMTGAGELPTVPSGGRRESFAVAISTQGIWHQIP